MTSNMIDILIPTFNNQQYLYSTLTSIMRNAATAGLFKIYVINNGHPDSCTWVQNDQIEVIQAHGNLGWEGGLKLAMTRSTAPYVMFLNDDVLIPQSSRLWVNRMLEHFKDPTIGAVGPASNTVMGLQNIFFDVPINQFTTKYLIGFCMLLRRSALDEVGGVDDSLPGGDDLDLSIRLRDKGYKLLVDREVFVYHHGFKTGERVYGTPDKAGGWNSYEFKEKTDHALIRKHGFRKWHECIMGSYALPSLEYHNTTDTEGEIIREWIQGDKVLDLGCGGNKTVPHAIGVDMVPENEVITTLESTKSAADVNADVSKPLPFDKESVDTIVARHILEHLVDSVTTIRQWVDILKPNGRLIIAVPNQAKFNSIPVNIEHVHAFTPDSLKTLLTTLGLHVIEQMDGQNNISFITVAEKI